MPELKVSLLFLNTAIRLLGQTNLLEEQMRYPKLTLVFLI